MSDERKKRPVRSYISELARGKRSLRFMIRLSSEERERLEQRAKQAGLTLSSFIRHLLSLDPVWLRKRRKAGDGDVEPPSSGASG